MVWYEDQALAGKQLKATIQMVIVFFPALLDHSELELLTSFV